MLKQKFGESLEVGCDEAGRGCLAGPVVAAAVLLPNNFKHALIKDSKRLSRRDREHLSKIIRKEALSFGIGVVSPKKIDQTNILKASILAMHKAIDQIKKEYDLLLIDGNQFIKYKKVNHQCVIKGDEKFMSIAAASILAKTYRDQIMKELSKNFPQYLWEQNQGYPTKKHREAIKKFGANIHHRKSFKLLPNQLTLFQ